MLTRVLTAAGCLLSAMPQTTWALFGDSIRPQVSYTLARDSNYYRVHDAAQALALLGIDNTAVTTRTLSLGLDADLKFSRQMVLLRGSLTDTSYDRPGQQGVQGGSLSADWQWVVGKKWNGDLAYTRTRAAQNQADFISNQTNVQDREEYRFSANYRLYPRVTLQAGVADSITTLSPTTRSLLNSEEVAGNVGVRYQTSAGSAVGLQFTRTEGRFPNQSAPLDQYRQNQLAVDADWAPDGLTQVHAGLGYIRRDDGLSTQKAPSWRLSLDWTPTGKIGLALATDHTISTSTSVLSANSSVNQVSSLGLRWSLTGKLAANALLSDTRQDFTSVGRKDDTVSLNLGLRYQAIRTVSFGVSYELGRRTSNQALSGYRYQTVMATVSGAF